MGGRRREGGIELAGTVVLALLGGLSGAMVAQAKEAAPDEVPAGWAQFSVVADDGLTVEATDPRVSGEWLQGDYLGGQVSPTGEGVYALPLRIENEGGAWQGTTTGHSVDFGNESREQTWLVGEGAYQGLSAVIFTTTSGDDAEQHGLIFEGSVPPLGPLHD